MRLSNKRITELQTILKTQTGKEYSTEEVQQIGISIVRFMFAKYMQSNRRKNDDTKKTI
jgi:hypothetical protein